MTDFVELVVLADGCEFLLETIGDVDHLAEDGVDADVFALPVGVLDQAVGEVRRQGRGDGRTGVFVNQQRSHQTRSLFDFHVGVTTHFQH